MTQMTFLPPTTMDLVRGFKRTSGQKATEEMGIQLIKEEYLEWREEVFITPPDYAAELKELADLVYVIYGYADTMGWDLEEAIHRVHENNMGRMKQPDGSILRREDGKIMKNIHYPKVFLADLVKNQHNEEETKNA